MDILTHSKLSVYKFGGKVEDYYDIHKFIDSSKLFLFHAKHRSVLHHTFGIELCLRLFGDTIRISSGESKMVRDIAAEHLKEDLAGRVPTIQDWFVEKPDLFDPLTYIDTLRDKELKEFVLQPYLNSGLKSSLLITFSDFGVEMVQKCLGLEKAMMLRRVIPSEYSLRQILKEFRFTQRWQYSPDMKQLNLINKK
ncbi:MAG: hypothetical protein AAFY71_09805 [Bacteroidota bacterium]